ncbi:MAG: hypothetical protein JXR97_08490 [Planctomycetes bacterium]|nr:hypothetical protein [Planctomycetota bacterium]
MRETLKNVAVFIVFIVSIILWNSARDFISPNFDFSHGKTVLLCVWSVCVVIIFHLLYHFLGKSSEKIIYLWTLFSLILTGGLVYFDKIPLY